MHAAIVSESVDAFTGGPLLATPGFQCSNVSKIVAIIAEFYADGVIESFAIARAIILDRHYIGLGDDEAAAEQLIRRLRREHRAEIEALVEDMLRSREACRLVAATLDPTRATDLHREALSRVRSAIFMDID